MKRANISGTSFRTAFVLLLVLGVTLLFLAVAWPFLKPLVLGAMLAGLCSPLYNSMTRVVGGRRSLAAALTLVLLFVLVAGPVSAFIGIVVGQALSVSEQAIPWVQQHIGTAGTFNAHDWLVQRFPTLAAYVPDQAKIMETVGNLAKSTGGFLVSGVSSFTAGTAVFLLNLFVMLYAMFFFFRDGPQIVEKILYYTPLSHADELRVVQRLSSVTRATIKGTLVIGIIQGALAGLGFWAAGIDGAAFWGTVMAILSIVPGIGAALVWIPGVIYLFIIGKTLAALLLAAWCAAVVGTVDNILRPTLVGKDARMPDLLILVGTLGGLVLFGPIGFIVGPVVCGLFLTVWEIYGATFKEILPPVKSLRTGEPKAEEATLELESPKRD
ncbi:MAG TPA: AI-2E family transporter [Chthoniobacterales bacterium]|nr:AI-2E family transporter [Chthoniobacterales bacterium]